MRRARCRRPGASGLLSVTPYYNKPTPDGLYGHYQAIAEATPLPIVVYNVPGRTGCNVDPATLARLATIPHVAGVKEASGNMTQICEVVRGVPPEFLVLCGDDALTLPAMAVGARGVVSVASNEVPSEMAQLVEAAEANDFAFARELHTRLLPLMLANFAESNPIPVKAADGADGPPRGELPAADGAAARRDAREARPRARERRARRGSRVSEAFAALRARVEELFAAGASASREEARACFARAPRPARARRAARRRARRHAAKRLARQRLGQAGDPAGLPPRRRRRCVDGPRPAFVLRQGHAAAASASTRRPACASSRAARPCATEPSSARASCACRRCTSTSARTSARAR